MFETSSDGLPFCVTGETILQFFTKSLPSHDTSLTTVSSIQKQFFTFRTIVGVILKLASEPNAA